MCRARCGGHVPRPLRLTVCPARCCCPLLRATVLALDAAATWGLIAGTCLVTPVAAALTCLQVFWPWVAAYMVAYFFQVTF